MGPRSRQGQPAPLKRRDSRIWQHIALPPLWQHIALPPQLRAACCQAPPFWHRVTCFQPLLPCLLPRLSTRWPHLPCLLPHLPPRWPLLPCLLPQLPTCWPLLPCLLLHLPWLTGDPRVALAQCGGWAGWAARYCCMPRIQIATSWCVGVYVRVHECVYAHATESDRHILVCGCVCACA